MSLILDQLPDDVLVHAMQYLEPADLLACRLVCKRLGDVALHREVWRHRQHRHLGAFGPRVKQCACPVLHLAPCLHTLAIHKNSVFHAQALLNTECAVKKLHYKFDFNSSHRLAAAVIRNQVELGCLRILNLQGQVERGDAAVLLKAVLEATSSLESLETKFSLSPGCLLSSWPSLPREQASASLKHYRFYGKCFYPEFVAWVLAGHAATLEEVAVEVLGPHRVYRKEDMSATCRLLAGLPKLRSLACPVLPGLEAVTARGTLEELALTLQSEDEQAAVDFFGRANGLRLRKVTLSFPSKDRHITPKVLGALVSSAARFESLTVLEPWRRRQMDPLVRALPAMSWLRQLTVTMGSLSDHRLLLEAITPHTAPALRALGLQSVFASSYQGEGACPHTWLHGGLVESVLTVNPGLHVQLHYPRKCPDTIPCMLCDFGTCHQEVRWGKLRLLGLFSHDPDQCSSPEFHPHSVSSQWIHTPF